MDFIEGIFGVSPDNGSGSLEAVLLVAAAVAIALLIARIRTGRWFAMRKSTPLGGARAHS